MAKDDPRYTDSDERELIRDIKKMDARIAPRELAQIKAKAEGEGLTFQTLVKSVVHKYVTGQLVDRNKKMV